jgi:DNA-binding NarL/FixJ family response regulator
MKKPRPIRVLLADDHDVLREGLALLIGSAPDMLVVAQAKDGREAVELFFAHHPDVALLDLRMPGMDGIQAISAIRQKTPDTRFILLTAFDGDEDIFRGYRAGASAYLLKTTSREDLFRCIRAVHGGQTFVPPPVASKLAARVARPALSERQMDVLRLMAAGLSNKEIGARLRVTEGTVKSHVNQVLEKLGTTRRTEAVAMAMKHGITHPDEDAGSQQ